MKKLLVVVGILVGASASQAAALLPAFPGVQGQGATTVGGRGGRVYKVTNLNDSGPGSLRAAVTASGPRIVVFDVSGNINLASRLVITQPYLTIAGQTSPGGVCVTGWETEFQRTHDVLVTHMRFRAGSHGQGAVDPSKTHAVMVAGGAGSNPVYNIVFDHCSFSWGIDETVDVAYNALGVTFSWCIIGPGLYSAGHEEGSHGTGMVFWGKYAKPNQEASVHHCFFPNNDFRDPEIGTGVNLEVKNDVAYNWHSALSPQFNHAPDDQPHSHLNYIHNYAKSGPNGANNPCGVGSAELFFCDAYGANCHEVAANAYPAIYYKGNLGCARKSQSDPEWRIIAGWSPTSWLSSGWRAATPFAFTSEGIPVTETVMSDAYADYVVAHAGATRPGRDSEDKGLADDYFNGTQLHRRANVSYPADFPILSGGAALSDAESDGMPDVWERAHGLNAALDDSAGDVDGDGYTNIEEYLHELGGYAGGDAPVRAGIIFEDNFDAQKDWSVPYTESNQLCNKETGCANVPSGYYGYYISKSVIAPVTGHGLHLNGVNRRGPSGKGLTFWDQTDGSANWTSGMQIGLDFPAQNGIYVRYWIKMQPNYVYYKGALANMLRKMNHISHYRYNGYPFTFFSSGGFFPTTVNQVRFGNANGLANIQNLYFIRPDPSYNGIQPAFTPALGTKDASNTGLYNYFDKPGDSLPMGNWNGTGTEYNSPGMFADGDWHCLEYHVKNNSAPGVADGVYKFWLDGVLQIDSGPHMLYREASSTLPDNIWNFVHIGGNALNPYLGPGGRGEQWYAVDDLVVSTSYIGPDYVIGSSTAPSAPPAAPKGLRMK